MPGVAPIDSQRARRRPRGWRPSVEPPRFRRGDHAPEVVERVAASWRKLGEDERRSVVGAALVAADLARLGAPAEILGLAARLVEDEVRHVAICRHVLEGLGAPVQEDPQPELTDPLFAAESVEARCARMLLAGFAVGEPMSAACFAAARRRTREPLIHWALTELLRDEARHGPFGIRAGAWVVRSWTSKQRRALWPECVAEMERFERALGGPMSGTMSASTLNQVAGSDGEDETRRQLEALGLLGPRANCEAAIAGIARLVLPPLAALGIVQGLT
jgi:hypothetical protein